MRLLNTSSFELEEFISHESVRYAILSHRWRDGEVLFKDMDNFESCTKAGVAKVRSACRVAKNDGYRYIWIDTCCIDKSSSAELGEAINSMFAWYRDSQVCYAHLDDVSMSCAPQAPTRQIWFEDFTRSSWFSRCWTLQELIAPTNLIFYDKEWRSLGSKHEHCDGLFQSTGIPETVFRALSFQPGSYCIAQKMSWAANRQASRTEDYAYSLLGIFDVAMPLNYGEGWKAFRRLQEAIIHATNDFSILAFEDSLRYRDTYTSCLAEKPQQFAKSTFLQVACGRVSEVPDLALEFKQEKLVLTTHATQVTQDIFAAFIVHRNECEDLRSRVYALLLRKNYVGSYVRLGTPSQLLGMPNSDAADIGLWSPPTGYTTASSLPPKRFIISPDCHQCTRRIEADSFSNCGFEISDIIKLPSRRMSTVLRNPIISFIRTYKVDLAPGAFRDWSNTIIYVKISGKNRCIPVCNVYFGANERALSIAHYAVKIWEDGRMSPICIIIDGTFPKQIPGSNPDGGIPNLNEIRKMQINYAALCSPPIVTPVFRKRMWRYTSTLSSAFRVGNSFQSSWMFLGNPCKQLHETEHFFMFKEFEQDIGGYYRRAALLYGRVEIESKPQCDIPGDNLCWQVKIRECYDGFLGRQTKLQRSSN